MWGVLFKVMSQLSFYSCHINEACVSTSTQERRDTERIERDEEERGQSFEVKLTV